MNTNKYLSKEHPFYLFSIGLFLIITSPNLLSEGLFIDGLHYSSIAKNMANGLGHFWTPHLTETLYPQFYEHPPLAFFIQSLFFRLFGESHYVDKCYSLLTFIVVGYSLTNIWEELGYKKAWFPLLIWLIVPMVSWACPNNILENTMSIFTTLSVLLYIKSKYHKKHIFLFLAGLCLSLAFLVKGFVGLFPLTIPVLWWVFQSNNRAQMWSESIAFVLYCMAPLILLFLAIPEAYESIKIYMHGQVINSLKFSKIVDSRFYIIGVMLSQLIIPVIFCLSLYLWSRYKKKHLSIVKPNTKLAFVFILLALSGVLPMMISLKQRAFYILAVFPFWAIGIGILTYPILAKIMEEFSEQWFYFFKRVSYVLFALGIVLSLGFSNVLIRDREKIEDVQKIGSTIPSNIIVNIPLNLYEDFTLQGYLARYKNISLEYDTAYSRTYLLIQKQDSSAHFLKKYDLVKLETHQYLLLKKK